MTSSSSKSQQYPVKTESASNISIGSSFISPVLTVPAPARVSKLEAPAPAPPPKRSCVLNTKKSHRSTSVVDSHSKQEAVYKLIDLLAGTTNYLKKFNTAETLVIAATKSTPNTTRLSEKLTELCELVSKRASAAWFVRLMTEMLDRIEFVSTRLNDELNKLLEFCLKTISTGGAGGGTSSSGGEDEASSETPNIDDSLVLKAFIDLLCLGLQTSFNLFIFRVSYIYHQLSTSSSTSSTGVEQINKLKENFFNVVYHILESIDFYPFTNSNKSLKIMMGENVKR